MQTSWNGIKFICRREALVTVAYHDGDNRDGSPKYSIGFGSQFPQVFPGDTISIDDAFARMVRHVRDNDKTIDRLLKVPVSQSEWDAMASLYYQKGFAALKAVTDLFNARVPSSIAILELSKWHSNIDGLAKRRVREMAMAVDGYYGNIETYLLFDGDPRTTAHRDAPFPDEPMGTT